MSKLYGTLQGCRGEATRCGSKDSGIRVSAQSYEGSVIVKMKLDENDQPIVTLLISEGSSSYGNKEVFTGSIEELKAKLQA